MPAGFKAAIILCAILFLTKPLICRGMSFQNEYRHSRNIGAAKKPTLSEDEISYALSELSVDDLKALSQLMDAISEQDLKIIQGSNQGPVSLDDQARFKRAVSHQDNDIQVPNVDEEYIKQLDDSFPNVEDQASQDDKEKAHIRVKRK